MGRMRAVVVGWKVFGVAWRGVVFVVVGNFLGATRLCNGDLLGWTLSVFWCQDITFGHQLDNCMDSFQE